MIDVLVAGAGPAGSITALLLARTGARVRVVDRAAFPRDKLCGDTLNPGALARLDALGLGDEVRRQSLAVTGMIVTGPGGARVAAEYGVDVRGAAIVRRSLDLVLLEAAIAAGVEFQPETTVCAPVGSGSDDRVTGVRVRGGFGEDTVRARVVVAAEGRHSRLAFALGLARYAPQPRRWAFGAYYEHVDGLTSFGEMHIRADGYTGVAPLPGGLTNVCVVRELRSAPSTERTDPAAMVHAAVTGDPMLRDRFMHAKRVTEITVLGPLAVDARAAGVPGLLLAGDAAGFIDPMTGDGLRFAIRGAELAAACAGRELETGDPMHDALEAARREEFAGKWRLNRTLRALVASPAAVRIAAHLASVWQQPVKTLVAVAGDVRSTRSP